MPRKPDVGRPLGFAEYDRRDYRTLPVEAGYALWAHLYEPFDRRFDIDLFERSALLARRVASASVVDLACGTGRIGRWRAAAGAREVVGVDLTAEMLQRADERGGYAELVQTDFCATGLEAGRFDGVVTSMALCHARDLGAVFREVARLSKPGGWFALVDYHPFFLMSGIPTHFHDPATGEPTAIVDHVHALSDYFRSAREVGLVLREFEERFVTDEWVAALPSFEKHRGWPVTFLMAFQKEAVRG
jgi:SAM-dependent methyltransferase